MYDDVPKGVSIGGNDLRNSSADTFAAVKLTMWTGRASKFEHAETKVEPVGCQDD